MSIPQSALRETARRAGFVKTASLLTESEKRIKQTAFLSHSHKDEDLAKGVQGFLQERGWEVYIDWEDTTMPDAPDRRTAARIKDKIVELNWFLFLATGNSMASRWCPWEIGYADGKKPIDSVIVIQTKDDGGRMHGSEYLQLYRGLSITTSDTYGVFNPGELGKRTGVVSLREMRR